MFYLAGGIISATLVFVGLFIYSFFYGWFIDVPLILFFSITRTSAGNDRRHAYLHIV